MKHVLLLGIAALLLFATGAVANHDYETDSDFDKELYFQAVDAYENGLPMTVEQRALLNAIHYQSPRDDQDFSRRTGGPDAAGYTFIDNEEPDGPPYAWIDITGDGFNVAPELSDDDHAGPFEIGFDFPFYGATYSQFYVQSNGTINFADDYITLSNSSIPTTSQDALIAWFWDDLDPDSGTEGQAWFLSTTVEAQNALVISYIDYDEYPDGPDAPNITAQVIMFEDGTVRITYDDMSPGFDIAGGTIGIQGNEGWTGLEYLYNGSEPGFPYPGLVVEFATTVTPSASITGTVYDQTGATVSGATVTIGWASAVTDNDGNYSMNAVFPGTYDYTVEAPGYLGSQGTVTVEDGPNVIDLELTAPLSTVSGVITASGGGPLIGAYVEVGELSTTTGNGGSYTLGPLFSTTYTWTVSAPGYIPETGEITLVDGDNNLSVALDENAPLADILIFDGDETPGSAAAIQPILEDAGYTVYYTTTFDEVDWSAGYLAVFAFMGIYPNDFQIDTGTPEEAAVMGYLNMGGKLYMEGGDIFGFTEPQNLVPMFGLEANDGSADVTSVQGITGEYTEGIFMDYAGESNWMDELIPLEPEAYPVMINPADGMNHMVFYANETWRTVATSFELGELIDGDDINTREYIVGGILEHLQIEDPSPVSLDLYGINTAIPPNGGQLVYDIQLVSDLPNLVNGLTFWTEVMLPNGTMYGPIMSIPFTMTPFMNVFITGATQPVPAFAPAGFYAFYGHAGFYNTQLYVTGDFDFEKIGTATDGAAPAAWPEGRVPGLAAGDNGDAVSALPMSYTLSAAHPNPFNPTTQITVALPDAAELTVAVYNSLGREVARLADGSYEAGVHPLTFDGSGLASGVYFVKAVVPGKLDQSSKLVLMK